MSSILTDALVTFREIVDEANNVKRAKRLADYPSDGRSAAYEHNGEITVVDVPPPLRAHRVDSVEDLIAAAKLYGGKIEASDQTLKEAGVIWVSSDRVVLVIDDADRRETVTLPLVRTPVHEILLGLPQRLSQEDLVRLLRCDLRCVQGAATTLTAVRAVKFSQSESGHANLQHGQESLGKAIELAIHGADAIPELLVCPTALYLTPGLDDFTQSIALDLEIDIRERKFRLRAMPGELEVATQLTLLKLRNDLTEALPSTPIFFGCP